jgi:UDP-GlcNAc:undecaprenyl-phosphate/decaprenyl-phosphate GlcNAc-1-phosphate transferase
MIDYRLLLGWALFAVGSAVTCWIVGWFPGFLNPPRATNYRGLALPLSLGIPLTAALVLAVASAGWGVLGNPHQSAARDFVVAAALATVFAVGFHDDRHPSRVRGLTAHFRELARGHLTSGILKLIVIVGAAVAVAAVPHASGWDLWLGAALVAGTANLFNLLDVAPGRSLKYGLLAAGALSWQLRWILVPATFGASAYLLPFDVRERAMLGDAGANVLGFALGAALLDRLSTPGIAAALAVVLLLHALAETVTLSRIIAAVTPLRWFDRLGRLPDVNTQPNGPAATPEREI